MRGLAHGDDDLFEQRSQQLLAIARRGGRRFPYALQIGGEREQAAPVFCAECSRSFTFAPGELGFGLLELAQALLPLALEAAGDETVLGIDSAITAFGTLCLVPGTFSGEPAPGERISFEPFGGGESGLDADGAFVPQTGPALHLGNRIGPQGRGYSITSSAWASSNCGTVRPSFSAVLRLMTSSNVVGSWNGSVAGLSPLKTRST